VKSVHVSVSWAPCAGFNDLVPPEMTKLLPSSVAVTHSSNPRVLSPRPGPMSGTAAVVSSVPAEDSIRIPTWPQAAMQISA
jgi:hypothetical protein